MSPERRPGYCAHCRTECTDRRGKVVYPHLPELAEKVFWVCVDCGARVGTHEDGPHKGKPLGTAANPKLREARIYVHGLLDPLWKDAWRQYPDASAIRDEGERRKALSIVKRTARKRVYEWLADRMGLSIDECHVSLFTLEECRTAYRALRGTDYPAIRDWAHARKAQAASGQEAPSAAT